MKVFFMVLVVMLFVGCDLEHHTTSTDYVYTFWDGVWHGMVAPFVWFISLFNDNDVILYAVNNNGSWYNFGFLIGISVFSSGSSSTTTRKKGRG